MSNRIIISAAILLCLLCADLRADQEPTVLEGFEQLSAVKSSGDVSAVQAGQGVTEGKSAAQLTPKASISVNVDGALFGSAGWVKVDTLTAQILSQKLHIEVTIGGHRRDRSAWAKGGKDTIALPVSVVRHSVPAHARLARTTIKITNTSESPITLDHLRLEPPAKAPQGAVLLDCGPGGQIVWPGFTAAPRANQYMVWSGDAPVYEYTAPYPDPLGKDFVGRRPSTKVLDYFALKGPGGKAAAVWLWVTHYASRAETQPTEYIMKVRGRTVLQERRSMRDMLTDEGLLLGKDGKWSAEWFDEKLAPSFVDVVGTQIGDGGNRVDVGNCQIAAIAMAPLSGKLAMARYVKQITEDLSRYRRQFVVGARLEPISSLEPTAKETEQGVMMFEADPDRIYDGQWKPTAAQRITKLSSATHAGGIAMFQVAVVPLKAGVLTGGSLRGFQHEETSADLGTVRGGTNVWAVNRVPRVRDATVEFVPFVLNRRSDALKAREIQIVTGIVHVARGAREGTYCGQLQLALGRDQIEVPAEIRVYPLEGRYQGEQTIGAERTLDAGSIYSTMASVFSDAQRDGLTRKLRSELFEAGINSMIMGGVNPHGQSSIRTGGLVNTLKSIPLREMDGAPVIDLSHFYRRLGWWSIMPASARHRAFSSNAVTEIKKVFAKASLPSPYLKVGSVRHSRGWGACLTRAGQIAAAGGKPALYVYAESLKGPNVAKAEKAFAAWVVVPDRGQLDGKIASYKKQGNRRAFINYHRADRYLCGFFSAGVGADGVFLDGLHIYGGTAYSGDRIDGRGLFVPADRGVGNFLPTINLIHIQTGKDDYALVRRCEDLLAKATKARVATVELEQALGAIRDTAGGVGAVSYDTVQMRTSDVTPSKLKTLRLGLIQAAAAVSNRMKGRGE